MVNYILQCFFCKLRSNLLKKENSGTYKFTGRPAHVEQVLSFKISLGPPSRRENRSTKPSL